MKCGQAPWSLKPEASKILQATIGGYYFDVKALPVSAANPPVHSTPSPACPCYVCCWHACTVTTIFDNIVLARTWQGRRRSRRRERLHSPLHIRHLLLTKSLLNTHTSTISATDVRPTTNGSPKCRRSNAHPANVLSSTGLQNGILSETDEKSLGTGRSRLLLLTNYHAYRLQYCVWLCIPCIILLGHIGICCQEHIDSLVGIRRSNGKCGEIDCQSTFDDHW